jgi:glycosyltransferase involved in cell wall biosynthesis
MPDQTPPPAATVVLPARNAAATIDMQLASLAAQDYEGSWEVVVVDNGSRDGTAVVVRRWHDRLPRLRVVACDETGVNRARNAGVEAAGGACVLCCDADDVVAQGWVRAMADALGHVDVVGGRLEYSRLNQPGAVAKRPAERELPIAFGGRRYAVGANFGFRRDVFDAVGGFDESFVIGSDEIDFCLRAQYQGFTIGFASEAVVHYRVRTSLRRVARQRRVYGEGYAHLYRKHIDLGEVPPQGLRGLAGAARAHARELAQVHRLLSPAPRRAYVADAAWIVGAVVGLVRHRVLV